MFRKLMTAVLLGAFGLTLAGCFEIEETVTIDPAGPVSSLIKLRLTMPQGQKKEKGAPGMEIKEAGIGSGIAGFESVKVTTREIYGQLISEILLKARSFKALAETYNTLPKDQEQQNEQGPKLDQLFTEKGFYQLKHKGNKIVITRTFLPSGKKPEKKKADDQGLGDLMGMMMGSMQLRLELRVPSEVISTNAEEQNGRTLRWVLPIDYLSTHKVVLQAEIEATPELVKALF